MLIEQGKTAEDGFPKRAEADNPLTPLRDDPRFVAPIYIRNVALSLLSALALLVLLRYARELFIPLALSLLIAYVLNPFVTLLERCRVGRTAASGIIVLGVIGLLGSGVYAVRHQASIVINSVPPALGKVRSQLEKWQSGPTSSNAIGKLQQAAKEIERTTAVATDTVPTRGVTKVQVDRAPLRVSDYLWSGSLGLLGLASDFVLVIFLVFFLLASGDLFKRKLVRLIGTNLSEKRMTVETLNEIETQIERFLLIQVFTSFAVGVCTAVALWAFGVNQPAFWGVAAGVFSSVPYLGPTFITLALMIAAFVQFDSMSVAAEIAAIPLVIFSVEGLLVKPAIMGKAARINNVAMFMGLLFWSWIWGLIGMLLAVPIMIVLKSVCDRVESLRPIGEVLDER